MYDVLFKNKLTHYIILLVITLERMRLSRAMHFHNDFKSEHTDS